MSGRPAWPLPSGPGPPVQSRAPAARHSRGAGLCLLTPPRTSPQSPNFPPQQSGQSWPGKRRLLPQTSTLSHHLPGVLLCHRRGVSCTPPAGRCLQRAGQHCPPHGLLPRKRNWGPWTPALYTPTKSASPGPTADGPGNTDGSVTKPGPVALSKDPLRPEALHPNHQTGHKTRHWTLDTARQATWPGRTELPPSPTRKRGVCWQGKGARPLTNGGDRGLRGARPWVPRLLRRGGGVNKPKCPWPRPGQGVVLGPQLLPGQRLVQCPRMPGGVPPSARRLRADVLATGWVGAGDLCCPPPALHPAESPSET